MDHSEDARGLAWWAGPGQDPAAAFAQTAQHPNLAEAARALASGMLGLSERDPALDGVFKDAGRYVATMWALYLHENGGLTLAALKAVCARSGLLSPGRARALLQFLEHLGYVARAPSGGRAMIYRPTGPFLAAWDAHLRVALAAGRLIEPELGRLVDDPDGAVVRAFGRVHAERLLTGDTAVVANMSFLRVFLHAFAGAQIVWALISADDRFPPDHAGRVSASQFARRFGVSRIHVRRILEDAEREALIRWAPDGSMVFEAGAQEQIRFLYISQIVAIVAAAATAALEAGFIAEADQKCAIVTVSGGP